MKPQGFYQQVRRSEIFGQFRIFLGKKKQKKLLCLIVQGDEMSSFFSSSADSQTQDVFICIGMTVEFI